MTLEIDHLAVAGETLEAAAAHVEEALGVTLETGGVHVEMGTHNRLLSLGPGLYLEAIAINPDARAPDCPRWFDLDRFSGLPRLTNWIARCDDLEATLAEAPDGMGVPLALQRGIYSWSMAVPGTGRLPYDGAAPALISWDGAAHPADRLRDQGCRLMRLEITHPDAHGLTERFPALLHLNLLRLSPGPTVSMRADIMTPSGLRHLR